MPLGYGIDSADTFLFSDARHAWPIQLPLVEMKPRGYSNGGLVSRFRSSQDLAAHSCANFGIRGTLADL
jgi:hypothetical protein